MDGKQLPKVFIVGGGFAGLAAAKALAGARAEITLIDRRNHHVFQPLLYQVATASLSPADISSPIRTILRRQTNCQVLLGELRAVDVEERRLLFKDGYVNYGVHIAFLIGFRNRLLVLLSWFWNWLLNARDARLITGDAQIEIQTPRPPEFVVQPIGPNATRAPDLQLTEERTT